MARATSDQFDTVFVNLKIEFGSKSQYNIYSSLNMHHG